MKLSLSVAICALGFVCGIQGVRTASADELLLLGPDPAFDQMKSFQKVLRNEEGTGMYEKARIDYLLERLRNSPYNFIRNGSSYKSSRAVAHLKWKYWKQRKHIKSAEEFIARIASGSRISGKPYLVQRGENQVHRLETFFRNELQVLDEELARRRQLELLEEARSVLDSAEPEVSESIEPSEVKGVKEHTSPAENSLIKTTVPRST